MQKIINQTNSKKSKIAIALNRQQVFNQNWEKKVGEKDDNKFLQMAYQKRFQDEFNHKKELWKNIMSFKLGHKQMKHSFNKGLVYQNVQKYSEKMGEKETRSNILESRIKQMEQKEAELLERLQVTQTNQQRAYSSLENIVSVGYNYYGQAYDMMKKKQSDSIEIEKLLEKSPDFRSAFEHYNSASLDSADLKRNWANPS